MDILITPMGKVGDPGQNKQNANLGEFVL